MTFTYDWLSLEDQQKLIHELALQLVERALAAGVVLTIETQPEHPLAMGHYRMRVATRPTRERYARGKQ